MLGDLAEALLTLTMVLIVPGLIVLGVLLVRLLARSRRRGKSERGDQVLVGPATVIALVALSIVVGAAAALIALEAYFVGIVLAAAAGVLLFRRARRHRWFALGGYLLGMGLCGAGILSAALTNHDAAVTYDPSTTPAFWFGVFLALCGAVILVAAARCILDADTLRLGPPPEVASQDPVVQSTHRRAAVALTVSTSALAVLAAVVLATELSQPAYVMPVWVVVVAAICVALTVIGGAAAAARGRVTPWLAPAVTGVLAVASLELFIITVPLALILLVLVTVRAVRRVSGRIPGDQSVGAPGFLLTVGLVPLSLLIFLGSPIIECTVGGGSSALPVWAWFGDGGSGSSGSFASGSDLSVSSGTETSGGTAYSWVCHGSMVVQFTTHR
jgi:hypothetical protein